MTKYKLLLAYDGSSYSGWQIQPNALSIQEVIETKMSILLKEPCKIVGSGRTDAGVHARGQVAHFTTVQPLELSRFRYALNGLLPPAIRLLEITAVPDTFHAQQSALAKIYHYHLWLEKTADPFLTPFHTHFPSSLSLTLLQQATKAFVGTHDFATFSNVGSSSKTTIRTIYRIDMIPQLGGIRLEFEGNGFLYKMVRTIVGTCLEVASGKRALSDIERLFAAKDRRMAGVAAPARGLFLQEVIYKK